MTWPQWTIAVLCVLSAGSSVFRTARDRSLSSGIAIGTALVHLAFGAGYAAVLHAGGFW